MKFTYHKDDKATPIEFDPSSQIWDYAKNCKVDALTLYNEECDKYATAYILDVDGMYVRNPQR